jgi:cellulose synthase/poly-beta-1,6-N-acetylglucosamine synthase-like glycosyltransferase
MAVLKDLVETASREFSPELLVFTDANTNFAPGALRKLCRPFADPAVGGVCGKLSFVAGEQTRTDENVYWRFENWLKAKESDIDSCLGANGAIYAIRRPLFWSAIPKNTIIDDFVIGMKVRQQGFRMVYEPAALAFEDLPDNMSDEWKRRIRIGAGNFQALGLCRACLRPSFGAFAWMFWSHKVLRWFTPHLMAAGCALAVAGFARTNSLLAAAVLAGYAGTALVALIGYGAKASRHPLLRLFRGIAYFLSMQVAILLGFRKFFQGNLEGRWERTAR